MDIQQVTRQVEAIENALDLSDAYDLCAREEALRALTFLHDLLNSDDANSQAVALDGRVTSLFRGLQEANERLFSDLRARIRSGSPAHQDLRRTFDAYTEYRPGSEHHLHLRYEPLDTLVDGILQVDVPLQETLPLEREMVHLEFSPASVILDLLDHVYLSSRDVFYDLGSGLGHVALLVSLLTDAQVRGVEREPAYYTFARDRIRSLCLSSVVFENVDARDACYDDGTLFYLFSPFVGGILQTVLDRLREQATRRIIRVCSYGSSTLDIHQERWLRPIHGDAGHDHALVVFESIS